MSFICSKLFEWFRGWEVDRRNKEWKLISCAKFPPSGFLRRTKVDFHRFTLFSCPIVFCIKRQAVWHVSRAVMYDFVNVVVGRPVITKDVCGSIQEIRTLLISWF